MIAAELHAVTVSRLRKFLGEGLSVDEAGVKAWVIHWLSTGFAALETQSAARPEAWPFCLGEQPGWADLHVVPQIANARRHGVDMAPYSLLVAIDQRCTALDAFIRARPDQQPDYPSDG